MEHGEVAAGLFKAEFQDKQRLLFFLLCLYHLHIQGNCYVCVWMSPPKPSMVTGELLQRWLDLQRVTDSWRTAESDGV